MAEVAERSEESERQRLASLAGWYFNEQLDFDKQLIGFGYETLKPHFQGPEALELGSGDGQMTRLIVNDFERLTVVDGAAELLNSIPDAPNLVKIQALFEEFEPARQFNTIFMAHILEHIEDPPALLGRARQWLAPGGKIVTIVPNGHSIHRLVAVKMGILKNPCELNPRDQGLGHRRVYTPEAFRKDFESAGLRISEIGGIFLKPLTHQQIQEQWTQEMIHGFYELGKDFPENAAEIYVVAELP